MKTSLSVLLIFLFHSGLYAQSINNAKEKLGQYCATDERHEHLLKTDTSYAARVRRINSLQAKRTANQRTESSTTIYYIPVVIHIIHDNGPENISDQQVMDGLKHLNDAYRHLPPFDGAGGADIGIQFCLAIQDTAGNPTTGIVRLQSPLTNVQYEDDRSLFELGCWDTRKYFNIWLVKEICLGEECRVNGYSTFPYEHGQPNDGLVIKALQFGRWENLSKIPIHETGHYFNLLHTFTTGYCKNDECTQYGDGICDTPPDASSDEIPCGTVMNSCTTDEDDHSLNNPFRPIALGGLGEQNDQTQNYMDYGNLDCINLFTEGQKTRMLSALLNVRSSLLTSTGCKPPCPFRVSFNSASRVDIDHSLSFINTSTGGTHFKWEIDDEQFSTATNANYTFHAKGTFRIRLYATDQDSSCMSATSMLVKVIPLCVPPKASFFTGIAINSYIKTGSSTFFASTSTGATDYKWYIDDIFVSNAANINNYVFNAPGIHKIKLLALNYDISCVDSAEINVTVKTPCPSVLASFTVSSLTVNPGDAVTFTNTSPNATRFSWTIDGTEFSTQANPDYTFNSSGSRYITLHVCNDDSSCLDYTSQSVYVRCPELHASIDIPPSAPESTTVLLSNNSAGATYFYWIIDEAPFSNVKQVNYIFTQPGIHEIKLLASNSIGCIDTAIASINITPYCLACLSPIGSPLEVELGSTMSFSDSCSRGALLKWTVDEEPYTTAGNKDFLYFFNEPGNHSLQLIAYNSDATCADTLSTSIKVIDTCKACFIPLGFPLQTPIRTTVDFYNSCSTGDHFTWILDGIAYHGERNDTFSYLFNVPGAHNLKLLSYNRGGTCADTISYAIEVINNCAACFTPVGSPLEIQVGSTVNFYDSCSTNADYLTWTIDGNQYYRSQNDLFSYRFNESGDYTLQLVVSDSNYTCRDTLSTPIKVIAKKEALVMLPNLITPNGDGLNDTFKVTGLSDGYTLEVYNQWDAVIYKKENYDNSFAADGLSSNIYFYNLYHPETGQSYRGWLHVVK